MANLIFNDVGISGIAATVPALVKRNIDMTDVISEAEIEKTINSIGIKEKRFTDQKTCASDLCQNAAERLFSAMNINRSTIDVLIFMSQTHDYIIPATAPLLQHRLGLPKSTAAFDLSLACSGYVYSLSVAYSFASLPGIRKVLLLDGETFSKIVNPKDKVNAPLYGDAGTATIIEKGNFNKSYFSLNSDGSGLEAININAGGCRNMITAESITERIDQEGNPRTANQLYMNGLEVFNFTIREVPRDIKNIMTFAGIDTENPDYFIFHQANRFMIDFFTKKLKINPVKVPLCLDRFGNTSSSSIPLTISSELAGQFYNSRKKILMSGFGAGLSWASAIMEMNNCSVLPVTEI